MANLATLRILEGLSGFLLVDKPAGIAFSSVVKTVKRKFNLVKVGHGGSLDASASGLLVLMVNDANRFTGDVMGADRSWEGTMRLGMKTNTHDVNGERVEGADPAKIPSPERIAEVLPEFLGDVFQTESRWCAVRREGSAAYEIADTGGHKPFMAHVYRFEPRPPVSPDGVLGFSLKGTKGLIVRTFVNDFGDALGCGAALASLRRTAVGRFEVANAVKFEALLETDIADFAPLVVPVSKFFA
jgi:tRNA pseudouridine55 synthase